MDLAKSKKSIKNLKKIKDIIDISKFDTLRKLEMERKINKSFYEVAFLSKELILFARKKYSIKAIPMKSNKAKTIWIFATISSSLLNTSYSSQEKYILNNIDIVNDEIVVIGEDAIKFAKKNMLKIFYESNSLDDEVKKLPIVLSKLFLSGAIKNLNFVSTTTTKQNPHVVLLPLENVKHLAKHKIEVGKSPKFYPSIHEAISLLSNRYLDKFLRGLLRETKQVYLHQKLIKHENSIKKVDEKLFIQKLALNKMNRKHETEELISITQIAKTGELDNE